MPLGNELAGMLDRMLLLFSTFEDVRAVGLSGSYAAGDADALSDVDVFVYAAKAVPSGEERLKRYREAGAGEVRAFDVDFCPLRNDVLLSEGLLLDLNWCAVPAVERFLRDLSHDFDADEFLPGGLLKTDPLYDPAETLGKLRRAVPEYTVERAVHRVRRALQAAQTEFEVFRRLEQAATRGDAYDFLKREHELLDTFFSGLFALNRRWFCDEKRLVQGIAGFPLLPPEAAHRIETIILHRGLAADLASTYDALQSLFDDLASLARQELGKPALPAGM